MSRRVRNFTVDAPKDTATNLSWNWAVLAQTEEIMALRWRCTRPNLTSRVCRFCSSTRSEKVMVEGLGRRVVEHVAVGCSVNGIEDVVERRAGGVDCDAWGVSSVKVFAEGGIGRRIVDARTWLQGAGGQCLRGGGSRGRGGGGGSGCGRAGSGGVGSLVGGEASLGAIGLLMPQLATTETTAVGLKEGAFGGGELLETRGLGGGGKLGGQALSFHPHEMDSLEVFLRELGWVKGLGRGVKVVVGGDGALEAGGCGGEPMSEGHVVEVESILDLREEKEDVLVGEAGERRDIGGAEGAGNVPVAGNDASEVVEVAVVRRGVVVGVILTAVTKEVARRMSGYGEVNTRKDLGDQGGKGDGVLTWHDIDEDLGEKRRGEITAATMVQVAMITAAMKITAASKVFSGDGGSNQLRYQLWKGVASGGKVGGRLYCLYLTGSTKGCESLHKIGGLSAMFIFDCMKDYTEASQYAMATSSVSHNVSGLVSGERNGDIYRMSKMQVGVGDLETPMAYLPCVKAYLGLVDATLVRRMDLDRLHWRESGLEICGPDSKSRNHEDNLGG
ncbi:hypothetical protein CBR_g12936 [Chara braunii]|uniref:Uncharacterized protein n=1 Tax=Chara braunii TaxID=69332 RepID=A0A388KT52_CHABU|nr:hypothetical protein CBR_g12936 [Chara braunii]|eukprot:GBG73219.1 hypothetical protein CBR_g12936 [Chara braunii]